MDSGKFEEGVLMADGLLGRYTNELQVERKVRCYEEGLENRFLSALCEFSERIGRKVKPDEAEAIRSVIESKE